MQLSSSRQTSFDTPRVRRVARWCALALILALAAAPAAAQGDEDRGYRDNLVVNQNGEVLVIWSPETSDDVSLELRLQSPVGGETTLASDGQAVTTSKGTETLVGFGSNPWLNNSGFAVFKGGIDYIGDDGDDAAGIFRVSTGGLTLLAEGRGDDPQGTGDGDADGQAFAGDTLCDFEPMPVINDANQVAFGVHLDRGDEASFGLSAYYFDFEACGSRDWDDALYDDTNDYPYERKAIIRHTPASGLQLLLRAYDDTILVANSGNTADYVAANTTFYITDASLTHTGSKVITSAGHLVARVLLDASIADDTDVGNTVTGCGASNCNMREAHYDDLDGLMYLRGPGDDYVLIAAGSPPGGGSIYQELDGAVVNDSGQVVFKGLAGTGGSYCGYERGYCGDQTWAELSRWTVAGGRQQIVETGDNPPNSTYYYQGFAPHYSIDSSGNVAFVAGLGESSNPVTTDECGQGVYYWNGSAVTEIARAMNNWEDWDAGCTADTGAGPFRTSFNGFVWEEIGSMASITDDGWVFFTAEHYSPLSGGVCDGQIPDDDEVTALFGWHPTQGMREIMREGGLWEGELVNRIYLPQPELRGQTVSDQFSVTVVLDSDQDCAAADPDDDTVTVQPRVEPQTGAPIPTIGQAGALLLVLLLAGLGVVALRRLS